MVLCGIGSIFGIITSLKYLLMPKILITFVMAIGDAEGEASDWSGQAGERATLLEGELIPISNHTTASTC